MKLVTPIDGTTPHAQNAELMAQRKPKATLTASTADKYALYQQSVQTPEAEVKFFQRVYRQRYGRQPLTLREDFCGTAAVCCAWVQSRADRLAFGFDIDPEPLRWGVEHNVGRLAAAEQSRVNLVKQDVRAVKGPKGDIVAAQNFSYFTFTTRTELLRYFSAARRNLATEGMFVLDVMGGSEVITEDRRDIRKLDGFRYVWEHRRFDPVTHHCRYEIHFRFPDGSQVAPAFVYEWRLWSIPEIRELLAEAGFKDSAVYWEGTDGHGEGDGVYRRCQSAPADPAWVSYVVGFR